MNDFQDKSLNEIEVQLENELEIIPLEPFDKMMAEIRPGLKKKKKQPVFKSRSFMVKFIAVATSIVLFLGIGLSIYFTWPENGPPTINTPVNPPVDPPIDPPIIPPDYRYEDADIDALPCQENDVLNYPELYVPNLNILFNTAFNVGIHKETQKPVFFTIEGYHIDDGIARQIVLKIILEIKYEPPKEEHYNNSNIITVFENEISVFEDDYDMPFYIYKLGFKIEDVRYYIDYQTTSDTNDIESFMLLFLD